MQQMKMLTSFFLICLSYSLLVMNNSLANPNVFQLRLIHPLSPKSPFFKSNLSNENRIKRSITQSNVHDNYLTGSSSLALRMKRGAQRVYYTVEICIGTFSLVPPCRNYYMEMDTGSSLTWLQCEGCIKCNNQVPILFNPKKSKSYHRGFFRKKKYQVGYKDGSYSVGELARETFYFPSNNGSKSLTKIKNLKFGCGYYNNMMYGEDRNNWIAGIFGLGGLNSSFLHQLDHLTNGIFSYCLPVRYTSSTDPYLTFGDAKIKPGVAKSTKLYTKSVTGNYYVELTGISINGTRLKINPAVFGFKSLNGLMVDSGTIFSRLVSPVFDMVKQSLENYFTKSKSFEKINHSIYELCYKRNNIKSLNSLPGLTFHFAGSNADFVMKGEAVYDFFFPEGSASFFCLAMMRDPKESILGSNQQTNHRISHDTKKGLLIFYPEDCSTEKH